MLYNGETWPRKTSELIALRSVEYAIACRTGLSGISVTLNTRSRTDDAALGGRLLPDWVVTPRDGGGNRKRHQLIEEADRAEQMERNVVRVWRRDHARCRVALRVVRPKGADIVQEESGASGEIE